MVDAVGYAEPLDERFEPNAAGYDKDERAVADTLQYTTEPAQKLIYVPCAVVTVKEALRKIGNSSMTRSTGLSCAAQSRSSCSP